MHVNSYKLCGNITAPLGSESRDLIRLSCGLPCEEVNSVQEWVVWWIYQKHCFSGLQRQEVFNIKAFKPILVNTKTKSINLTMSRIRPL